MKHHYCSPSFLQGVRRISALLVCMLFTFVFVVSPIKVKAEALPIPPVWLPMNPYNAQGLEGNYVLLNDDQKEIVKEIIGAVNIVNLGFGQYVLMNPISGVANTRQFLRDYGGTFLETFWTQIMGTSRAMTDFVGSTIYKASTYNSLAEYEADTTPSVSSGSQKYFQISPELTVAFKNWYRANGGVEDWQTQVKPFTTDIPFNTTYGSSAQGTLAYNYVDSFGLTVSRGNLNSSGYFSYCYLGFAQEYNLFLNISTGKAVIVNANGETVSSPRLSHYSCIIAPYGSNPSVYYDSVLSGINADYYFPQFFNALNLSFDTSIPYVETVRKIFNAEGYSHSYIYSNGINVLLDSVVKHVYVGADWSSKQEIYNIDDLNIGSSPSEYIDNISDTGYVDINTLIGKIADEVINLREVVEESVLVKDNNEAVPYAESLQVAIDKYINQPESGVVIPSDIFGGLTGANGPVSYLWFMTKPLVSYTGDLLGLLTLDGDGTFQFTGLGYIVIGVVTIGIIGGLVTKCLL